MTIRPLEEADYAPIIGVIDSWWGGRHVADMLPKLFFVHFRDTSFAAEHEGEIVGFLVGFVSQTHLTEAYIHFVGVHPDHRKQGIGEQLYAAFFSAVKARGCTVAHSVTSPVNKTSIAFHTRMGFVPEPGDAVVDGIPVKQNYDGRGQDRVLFAKRL